MKDTYWLVLACFVGMGAVLWLATLSTRMSVERRLMRGETIKKKSIWTRDLLDNRFGRAIRSLVIPPLVIGWGLIQALTGEARWKQFDYHGFDAVCIGVGTISIGLALLTIYTFPARDSKGDRLRSRIILVAGLVFTASFTTALFRNI